MSQSLLVSLDDSRRGVKRRSDSTVETEQFNADDVDTADANNDWPVQSDDDDFAMTNDDGDGDDDWGGFADSDDFDTVTSDANSHSLATTAPALELPQCFHRSQIPHCQQSLIQRVSTKLDVTLSAATAMLRHCKWKESVVFQQWNDNYQSLVVSSHIALSLHSDFCDPPSGTESDSESTCPICFDDVTNGRMIGLPCCHRFCHSCWQSFLYSELCSGSVSGTSALNTHCPEQQCRELVGQSAFEMLLDDDATYSKYQQLLHHSFVDDSDELVWCPRAGCERVIHVSVSENGQHSSPTVTCVCSEKFCNQCLTEAHAPTSCTEAMTWRSKDKGTINLDLKWMLDQTKPCPKCGVRVRREGGCMFIHCSQCHTAWCWHCGKADHHVWECERSQYLPDGGADSNELNRYLFYYEKFVDHGFSLEATNKQIERVQAKMSELVSQGEHFKRVQFLMDACLIVAESRRVLRWSYAHCYFIARDSTELRLFEYRQKELERFTESLNQLTEGKVEKLIEDRLLVLDYTRALRSFVLGFEADQTKQRVRESYGTSCATAASAEADASSAAMATTPQSVKGLKHLFGFGRKHSEAKREEV